MSAVSLSRRRCRGGADRLHVRHPDPPRRLEDRLAVRWALGRRERRAHGAPLHARSSGSSTSTGRRSWCRRWAPRRCAPLRTRWRLTAARPCCFSSTRSFRSRCASTATACTRRSSPQDEVRELEPDERARVERFIDEFTSAQRPIRDYRAATVTPSKLRDFGRHIAMRATVDADNEYLVPRRYFTNVFRERARAAAARALYEPPGERPFVYFPLHVVDDYKIKRVIPHCYDQASIIEQVADALPHGVRDRAQGASDVGRAQRARAAPAAEADSERPPGEAAHELARPDPPRRGRRGDLLDGRPGGAPVRPPGAHARPALLLRLRRDSRRRLIPRDPRGRARGTALPTRP